MVPFLLSFFASCFSQDFIVFWKIQDVPEFVIISEGLFPFYPDLFHHPHKMARIVLAKTIDAEDIVC